MKWLPALAIVLFLAPRPLPAAEYSAQAIKDPPPAAELASEIAAQLSPGGFKVIEGEKHVVCEIWPAKTWTTKADFQPTDTEFSPLEVGSLVGVLRFTGKGADFRDQEIPAGVYTLRFGNQPVDGKHIGTFPTRDFLLMVPANADQDPKPTPEADLLTASAQSAGANHPAIMPLVKPQDGGAGPLRHLDDNDWWTLRLPGQDAKGAKLVLELIVVGKAAE